MAGLCAAYFMRDDHEVELFESQNRVGGNAYTLDIDDELSVDIAVAAFGRDGYPEFYALLDELGVQTRGSGSGFLSVHDLDSGRGFYLAPTWSGLRAQRFALLKPKSVRTLLGLSLGLAHARRLYRNGAFSGISFREGLELLRWVDEDGKLILLCALCLMSSMGGEEVLDSPAEFFFGKLAHHSDVVSPRAFYSIRTVVGGTRAYVSALERELGDRVEKGAEVVSVRRDGDEVELELADGSERRFDRVVFACNADQTLGLLEDPSPLETELLSPWRYKEGRLVVHRDDSAFPPRPLMQAFTFLYRRTDRGIDTSVNGMMRFLAGVPNDCDLIGSQHPNFPIDPESIVFDIVFRTPIFDDAAVTAQPRLEELNGHGNCFHCGSHFGYGLHEDSVRSARRAAIAVGQTAADPVVSLTP